jgi:hypothetical protein
VEGGIIMMEVFLTVQFKGKNYQTNVIAQKGMTCDQIKMAAEEQIEKQWNRQR